MTKKLRKGDLSYKVWWYSVFSNNELRSLSECNDIFFDGVERFLNQYGDRKCRD